MDRRARHVSSLAVLGLALAALSAPAAAQRARTYTSEEHGFEVKVPTWLEVTPLQPDERQILMQFKGKKKSNARDFKGEQEIDILIVRILRAKGPKTGKPDDEKKPEMKSFADQSAEHRNSGTTLPEFLERHGFQSHLVENTKLLRRPITDEKKRAYKVFDKSSARGVRYGAIIRCYVVEDETEIFGVVAMGPGLNPFDREVQGIVKSLERIQVDDDADDGKDPYADSELRDIEGRRRVRDRLVRGWKAYDTENFILVTNVRNKRLISQMLIDLEVMRSAYLERFPPAKGVAMDAVSTVRVCDGYEDYLNYAGRDKYGTGGYWSFMQEELVIYNPERQVPKALEWTKGVDPKAVLYHEAMHQYFHYSNGQLAPASWFNEGYGEYFGGASINRNGKEIRRIGLNDFRMQMIRAERKGRLKRTAPELAEMLRMTQPEFYGFESLRNYAYSWAFCYFLEQERGKRKPNKQWAELPDRYVEHLRAATDKRRKDMPKDAPKDWITGFTFEIQKEAIEATLKGVDMAELQDAFEKAVARYR